MAEATVRTMPPADRALRNRAAIVGLGETDYQSDFVASRKRPPGYEPPLPEQLAATAFERALADAGLKREDIDGLSLSYIYGGPSPADMAAQLDLKPRLAIDNGGIMAGPLPVVCQAIAEGNADTVAMIYAAASRAIGRTYGGRTYDSGGGATPASYYYYLPWGWSSQAAHWAFVWSRYMAEFGKTEADLGAVAMQLRANAAAKPDAVMQAPMTLGDYLAARYIVRPLRLLDLCLVNDGAVCLIVRRADLARGGPHAPVLVSGWGEAKVRSNKLDALVNQRLRPQLQAAGAQALGMAGLGLADIGHLEAYDASSIHLISQLEGLGFVAPGQGLDVFQGGGAAPGGVLPVNTAGGMLSDAYMHGWNHIAEVTRQLRHEAGERQIAGLQASMSCLAQTDQAHPMVFTRGER